MGSETELKLRLTPSLAAAVRQELRRFGSGATVVLDNTYYDTADRLLLRHGLALRVRRFGRRAVQTLKTGGGSGALSRRGEWEIAAPRGRLDVRRFAGTPLATLLRRHPRVRLLPLFTTRFTRRLWVVETPQGRFEAAVDSGWIASGSGRTRARERLHELELELKLGDVAALPSFALELQRAIGANDGLVPYSDSKAARGYRLATNAARKPVKANAAAFAGALRGHGHGGEADDVATLARAYVARGTELLLANTSGDPPLDDPEFVHQARVAMRRLRSVLRLLRDEVHVPARCADAMRWIARELGRVRDLDVLALTTLPALKESLADLPARPLDRPVDDARELDPRAARALLAAQAKLQRQRKKATARLRELLRSRRYAMAVLRLLRWSAEAPPAGAPDEPRPTLREVAWPLLKTMHRRLARDAERFMSLPPPRQHRVRIRIKRLRYALDLCAPVLPEAGKLVALVEDVQDTLGEMNDLAVLDEALPRLTSSKRLLELAHARRSAVAESLAARAQEQLQRVASYRTAAIARNCVESATTGGS